MTLINPKAFRRFTRTSGALASMALVIGITAACGSGHGSGSSSPVTLRVLQHTNPSSDDFFKNVFVPAFEQKYPNVHVALDIVAADTYFGTVKSQMAAKAVDIVESPGGAPQSPPAYVKGAVEDPYVTEAKVGGYLDLSSQPFVSRLTPSIKAALPINGKTYAFPEGITLVNGIYYNKTMFSQYNIPVPTTWDQFVTACQTLQSHGVTPLAMGGKDVWPAGLVMLGAVGSLYPDLDALNKGLWTGSVKLNDPTAVEVMNRIKTIYSFTQSTFPGTPYATVDSEFTNGQVAMVPDGSWAEPAIAAAKPTVDFGYFPLPASDTASDNVLNGKVEAGLAVVATTKAKTAALDFLNMLSEPDMYAKYTVATGFISAESGSGSQSAFLTSISSMMPSMKMEWETHFSVPANATNGTQFPFDYTSVAPMGHQTDMQTLADQMEANWSKAIAG